MINQKIMMYIFKICKSSLLQVPRWGGRNYLKKKYLKGRLKAPQKLSLFGFQRGVKCFFLRFFSWKVWKKGQGLIFQHNFLAWVTVSCLIRLWLPSKRVMSSLCLNVVQGAKNFGFGISCLIVKIAGWCENNLSLVYFLLFYSNNFSYS